MTLFGLDIYQGDDAPTTPQHIDFAKMRDAGASFVIVKAGQNMVEDALFRSHVANAKLAGLIVGAYYYLDRRTDLGRQGAHFAQLLQATPVNLPPYLDFEIVLAAAEAGTFRLQLKAAANAVRDAIGRCGIYTSRSKWAQLGTTDPAWVALMPYLWIAQYLKKFNGAYYKTLADVAAKPTPTVPPWSMADIWQFTPACDGVLYGLESKAGDGNRFDGSLDDLHAMCIGLPQLSDAEKLRRLWDAHPELHW